MRCLFTFAVAAALAVAWSSTSWSQTGGAGGGGASAGAGGTSAAGGINTGGTANGGVGAAGPGAVGNVGSAPQVGAAGSVGVQTAPAAAPRAGAPNAVGNQNAIGNNAIGNRNRNGAGLDAQSNVGQRNVVGPRNARGPNGNANTNMNGFNDGISQRPFFTDIGARNQLNMTTDQFNTMNRAYQDAYGRYNTEVNKLNSNASLNEQQRALQMQQLQAQFNQSLAGNVNSTLTSPQAQARYNQLNRQYMGYNAFNDPAVRRQLNLTPDQTRQLRTLSNNWRQQLQQYRNSAGSDFNAANQAQWALLQQQYASQLNGVLTPEQQQLWSQQIGQAYSFPPNMYFGNDAATGSAGQQVQPAPGTTVPIQGPENAVLKTQTPGTTPGASQGQGAQGGSAQGSGSQGALR